MRTAVAISAFNRPYYFLPTLRSILANASIAKCDLWLCLDGGLGNEQRLQMRIAEELLDNAVYQPLKFAVVQRTSNFGCGRNLIDLRRRLFDFERYDELFLFEDDMVVAPNYMQVCENLRDWALERYTDVGVVQAYGACWLTPTEKACRLDEVQASNSHWWGYLLPSATWRAIRDLLYEYESEFLVGRPYSRIDVPKIRAWHASLIRAFDRDHSQKASERCTTGSQLFPGAWDFRRYFATNAVCGQDATTALALALCRLKKIVPVVNRGLPIGRRGIHSTDTAFARRRLDRIKLDVFESDSFPREFRASPNRQIPLKAYMRADEVEAFRRLIRERRPRRILEIGGGGSTVTLAREVAIEQWWTIESDDAWLRRILAAMTEADRARITVLSFQESTFISRLQALLGEVDFDLIFVDSGARGKILALLHDRLQTRPVGVLLHDYARPAYAAAINRFARRTQISPPARGHQGLLLLETQTLGSEP